MKIAIGGMQKREMEEAVKKACPEAETIVTTDMGAVPMLKDGRADYYLSLIHIFRNTGSRSMCLRF